jgi:uncharacterized protein YjbI with pentapeptide repeats
MILNINMSQQKFAGVEPKYIVPLKFNTTKNTPNEKAVQNIQERLLNKLKNQSQAPNFIQLTFLIIQSISEELTFSLVIDETKPRNQVDLKASLKDGKKIFLELQKSIPEVKNLNIKYFLRNYLKTQIQFLRQNGCAATLKQADHNLDSIFFEFDLSGLLLSGVDFSGSNLRSILFKNSDLCEAVFDNGTFNYVDFSNAKLEYASAEETTFENCQFIDSNFTGSNLASVTFKFNSKLTGADFSQASLQKASFLDSNLRSVDFTGANLDQAKFKNVDLTAVKFLNVEGFETVTFENVQVDVDFLEKYPVLKEKYILEVKGDDHFLQRNPQNI